MILNLIKQLFRSHKPAFDRERMELGEIPSNPWNRSFNRTHFPDLAKYNGSSDQQMPQQQAHLTLKRWTTLPKYVGLHGVAHSETLICSH